MSEDNEHALRLQTDKDKLIAENVELRNQIELDRSYREKITNSVSTMCSLFGVDKAEVLGQSLIACYAQYQEKCSQVKRLGELIAEKQEPVAWYVPGYPNFEILTEKPTGEYSAQIYEPLYSSPRLTKEVSYVYVDGKSILADWSAIRVNENEIDVFTPSGEGARAVNLITEHEESTQLYMIGELILEAAEAEKTDKAKCYCCCTKHGGLGFRQGCPQCAGEIAGNRKEQKS
jgi:hypothetical protein